MDIKVTKEMQLACLYRNLQIAEQSKEHAQRYTADSEPNVWRWVRAINSIQAAIYLLNEEDTVSG